jgi:DNA mismatch endonuclease, patch repair protein
MESQELRRRTMQAVKSQDTAPEMAVRRLVFAHGFRYRLHAKELPGKPDLVFPRLTKVIFVHGCFWHGHGCARGARIPVHNREYWVNKIARNATRDRSARAALKSLGWTCLVIWECELKKPERLKRKLFAFLGVHPQPLVSGCNSEI